MAPRAIGRGLSPIFSGGRRGFSGNFAQLFTSLGLSPYHVQQMDMGITYGGTPAATGTTPPVGTLTGTLTGPYIPLWFVCTNTAAIGSGATFSAYADDAGVTPFMTGITPTAGVPVALTGVGAGLLMAWAAGTATVADAWKAGASAVADQTTNAVNFANATASEQPPVGLGINGIRSLKFTTHRLGATLNLVPPGTTALTVLMVMRMTGTSANAMVLCSDAGSLGCVVYNPAASGNMNIQQFNGAVANNNSASNGGAWGLLEAGFQNAATDFVRFGSGAAITGTNALNNDPAATRQWGANALATNNAKFDCILFAEIPGILTIAQSNAIRAAVTQWTAGLAAA